MVKTVNTEKAKEIIATGVKTIVKFSASWCGPCKMYAVEFAKMAEENEDTEFLDVDVDSDTEFASEMGVLGTPTTVTFKDGKEVDRFTGFANKARLEETLAKEGDNIAGECESCYA